MTENISVVGTPKSAFSYLSMRLNGQLAVRFLQVWLGSQLRLQRLWSGDDIDFDCSTIASRHCADCSAACRHG